MSTYTMAQATAVLRKLGWRIRTTREFRQAVAAFQEGYALGARLAVDSQVGPATTAALARSLKAGGLASPHFRWAEFACTCRGRFLNCRRILIDGDQIRRLEKYRAKVGHPVRVISGYRCPGRNAEVGGASSSQHVRGTATDVADGLKVPAVQPLGFTGIGRGAVTGTVQHVDSRPGGLTQWAYPRS